MNGVGPKIFHCTHDCPYFNTTSTPFIFSLLKPNNINISDKKAVTIIIPATGILFVALSNPILAELRPATPILIIPTRADALPRFLRIGARASAIPLGDAKPIHNNTRNRKAIFRFMSNQWFVTPVK